MILSKNINVTTTDVTELLQIPNGYIGNCSMIFVSNLTDTDNTVSITIGKGEDPDSNIFLEQPLTSKEQLSFPPNEGGLLVLLPEQTLEAQLGSVGNVEFIVTLDVVYSPFSFNNM